jgi:hypothetical protein
MLDLPLSMPTAGGHIVGEGGALAGPDLDLGSTFEVPAFLRRQDG